LRFILEGGALKRTEDADTIRAAFAARAPIWVDLVIGETFVVSHDDGGATTQALRQELLRSPRILARGAPWVAHALLDRLIDAYFPVIDSFDDEIESVEGDVLAHAGLPKGRVCSSAFSASSVRFRRFAAPRFTSARSCSVWRAASLRSSLSKCSRTLARAGGTSKQASTHRKNDVTRVTAPLR
jgi:Mg2+ and Co2+ transporter CorA